MRIIIDAGHGGYDNGATYQDRKEKDDNLKLALAVGNILAQNGYDVQYTRTTDVYDSPVQKAQIANALNGDFFVSVHRNSSPTDNQYNGVQTLIFDPSGIKQDVAYSINQELEKLGFRNINVDIRPNLAVLKRTKMPAVLVEAGFINSDKDNEIFDSRFNEVAQAIADGIMNVLDENSASLNEKEYDMNDDMNDDMSNNASDYKNDNASNYISDNMNDNSYNNIDYNMDNAYNNDSGNDTYSNCTSGYQILIGVFNSPGAAIFQANYLKDMGYEPEIYKDGYLYQVRTGCFSTTDEAVMRQNELRDKGFSSLLVKSVDK